MPMQTPEEAEEIQAVLSSASFASSPSLLRLLRYLCGNHFSAKKCTLNEYRIGVEALGRPEDFDPAKNSSVRVEVHRLRAKLRSYYETEGANHACRIVVEDGHYGLQFVRREEEPTGPLGGSEANGDDTRELADTTSQPGSPAEDTLTAENSVGAGKGERATLVSARGVAVAATAIVLVFVAVWVLIGAHPGGGITGASVAHSPSVVGASTGSSSQNGSVLILAGYPKEKYIDRDGKVWGGDRYFTGGEATEWSVPFIQGTMDSTMYRTARTGEFSYDIPTPPGVYELRLHFVETRFGPGTYVGRGESSRVFSVFMNDKPLLTHFDVLSDAGGNFRTLTRVFKGVSPSAEGKVHLRFLRDLDQPFINAIELVPEIDGRMNAVRIVMQENSYVDHAGQLWASDQYAVGGVLAIHQSEAINVADPHLYDGERFGHFAYQIPVASGRYTVTLHFTEAYFGTQAAQSEHGGRFFDVYLNGEALLRNFSISEKAGGSNRPIRETFHGVEPNAAGLIVLSFVPVRNYACVNAIEVTDESPPAHR